MRLILRANSVVALVCVATLLPAPVLAQVNLAELESLTSDELAARRSSASADDTPRLLMALGAATLDIELEEGFALLMQAEQTIPEQDRAGRAVLQSHLCVAQLLASHLEDARKRCSQSLLEAQESASEYALTKAFAAQARFYYHTGEVALAAQMGQQALEHAVETGSVLVRALQYSNMGVFTRAQGLLLESVEYFTTASDLLAQVDDHERRQLVSFNIGTVYADLQEHTLAKDFFAPTLEWARAEKLYARELTALIYIAISDVGLGNAEFAQRSLEAALARPEMHANPGYIAFAFAVLGEAFLAQNRHESALDSFENGLAIAASAPNTFEQWRLNLGYARSLGAVARTPEAIAHLEPIVEKLRLASANQVLIETLTLLTELYTAAGNLPATVATHEELDALTLNFQAREFEQELARARARYEVDETQRELMAAERDNIIRSAALLWMLALALIGYLYLSRRTTVLRAAEQERHARELELQVSKRTEELREQIAQVEATEQARHELEQQLAEAEKLRVLGQLTGGVAHDFNNLLTIVVGAAELMQLGLDGEDEKQNTLIEHIVTAANSGADITRALMAYARKQPMQLEQVNLNELLANRIPLVARTLGGTMDVVLDIEDGPPIEVVLDPAQLTSALINLCLNARDAQNNLGNIHVRVALEKESSGKGVLESAQRAMISVFDTGVGMSQEQISRAVEPFYTTKHASQGNGLGLSMVYGFSKQIGGDLEIHSRPGAGTEVRILLPVGGANSATLASQIVVSEVSEQGEQEKRRVQNETDRVRELAVKSTNRAG